MSKVMVMSESGRNFLDSVLIPDTNTRTSYECSFSHLLRSFDYPACPEMADLGLRHSFMDTDTGLESKRVSFYCSRSSFYLCTKV